MITQPRGMILPIIGECQADRKRYLPYICPKLVTVGNFIGGSPTLLYLSSFSQKFVFRVHFSPEKEIYMSDTESHRIVWQQAAFKFRKLSAVDRISLKFASDELCHGLSVYGGIIWESSSNSTMIQGDDANIESSFFGSDRKEFLQRQFSEQDLSFMKMDSRTSFAWRDLNLVVKGENILSDISGSVKGGQVCALLGSETSQKDVLMQALAGRLPQRSKPELTGQIVLNHAKLEPAKVLSQVAFIKADDHLYSSATPRELLTFAASLRLKDKTAQEVSHLVTQCITAFKLGDIADKQVGYFDKSNIEAGKRKRLSIAVDMLTGPKVLILMEPLKHCNHYEAWTEVKLLHTLAESTGVSILCTLEQPRSEVFNQFDNVMVMSSGKMVFHGRVADMPQVMAKLGKPIPFLSNPADFLLFVTDNLASADLFEYNIDTGKTTPEIELDLTKDSPEAVLENGAARDMPLSKISNKDPRILTTPPILTQCKWLITREIKNIYRLNIFPVILARAAVFLIIGGIMSNAGDRDNEDFRQATLFPALLYLGFGTFLFNLIPNLAWFIPLKQVFVREMQVQTYNPVVLFSIRIFFDLIQMFVGALTSVLALYWVVDLQGEFSQFLLVTMLVSLAAHGIGQFASSFFTHFIAAFLPGIILFNVILSGYFLPVTRIDAINWMQYLSVVKYAVNSIVLIEFDDCGKADELDDLILDSQLCGANCSIDFQEELIYKQGCIAYLKSRYIDWELTLYLEILFLCGAAFKIASNINVAMRSQKFLE